jgi:arabinoxylan arabinofuranohydrolase
MKAPNFFEAAWVFKRNGTYYFSYSTTPAAAMRIDYMISDHPIDGFEYRGVVADQPPLNFGDNNHSAQFEFKDHWYHVYHNRIVAKQAGIPTGFRRNIGVEELAFADDGTINKIAYSESGVRQLGHVDPYQRIEAETFCKQQGVETQTCDNGGMNLTELAHGDWVTIAGVDFGPNEASQFKVRVASDGAAGQIELRADGPDGRLLGTCQLESTGGWQSWKEATCEIDSLTGVVDLCLRFTGEADQLPNVDCWQFVR